MNQEEQKHYYSILHSNGRFHQATYLCCSSTCLPYTFHLSKKRLCKVKLNHHEKPTHYPFPDQFSPSRWISRSKSVVGITSHRIDTFPKNKKLTLLERRRKSLLNINILGNKKIQSLPCSSFHVPDITKIPDAEKRICQFLEDNYIRMEAPHKRTRCHIIQSAGNL